jgi:uncharacterized protein YdhG (YjbR/CyaY superfamily)
MRGYAADTVTEYLSVVPESQREALTRVRTLLRDAIPGVTETISYQIPVFTYRGRGLVGLSAARTHCSLHLMSPPAAAALKGELTEGTLSGATLQFPNDAPLSEATIRRIVAMRMAEVDARLD